MDMRTPPRSLIKPRDQDFICLKNRTADRADSIARTVKAVNTAPDVHEPLLAAIRGGENCRAYQFPFGKLPGTYRASLGGITVTGRNFAFWFFVILFTVLSAILFTLIILRTLLPGDNAKSDKKGKTQPEQGSPYNYKSQNFQKLFHLSLLFFTASCSFHLSLFSFLFSLLPIYYTRGCFVYYRYTNRKFG
jgi:hypothetical protein